MLFKTKLNPRISKNRKGKKERKNPIFKNFVIYIIFPLTFYIFFYFFCAWRQKKIFFLILLLKLFLINFESTRHPIEKLKVWVFKIIIFFINFFLGFLRGSCRRLWSFREEGFNPFKKEGSFSSAVFLVSWFLHFINQQWRRNDERDRFPQQNLQDFACGSFLNFF